MHNDMREKRNCNWCSNPLVAAPWRLLSRPCLQSYLALISISLKKFIRHFQVVHCICSYGVAITLITTAKVLGLKQELNTNFHVQPHASVLETTSVAGNMCVGGLGIALTCSSYELEAGSSERLCQSAWVLFWMTWYACLGSPVWNSNCHSSPQVALFPGSQPST